jgi:hypothetical protein
VKCPYCGVENAEDVLQCTGCGEPLDTTICRKEDLPPLGLLPDGEEKPAPGEPGKCYLTSPILREPLELAQDKPARIGRSKGSQLVLPSIHVSRWHATVLWDRGCYWIQDEGSRNGTFLNGNPVTREPLKSGDQVGIGFFILTFIEHRGDLDGDRLGFGRMEETTRAMSEATEKVRGDLSEVSVIEMIKILEFNQKTGILKVHGKTENGMKDKGSLYFLRGVVIHADTKNLGGEEAVERLITLKEGRFEFGEAIISCPRTIRIPASALLIKILSRMDESRR